MLTEDQKNYLNKIPANKKVKIFPFNKKAIEISDEIIASIKRIYSDLEVIHMGASALGISGQNDLDIYALASPTKFKKYLPGLTELFGKPLSKHSTFIEWNFDKNGFHVEFYLTSPNSPSMKRQMTIFEILNKDKKLLKKYEKLKTAMDGKSLQEYHRKKYEFYHRIMDKLGLFPYEKNSLKGVR